MLHWFFVVAKIPLKSIVLLPRQSIWLQTSTHNGLSPFWKEHSFLYDNKVSKSYCLSCLLNYHNVFANNQEVSQIHDFVYKYILSHLPRQISGICEENKLLYSCNLTKAYFLHDSDKFDIRSVTKFIYKQFVDLRHFDVK